MSMKRLLFGLMVVLLFFLYNASAATFLYEAKLPYSYGNVSIAAVQVIEKEHQTLPLGGDYRIEILSDDDTVLGTFPFQFPTEIIYDQFDEEVGFYEGGSIQLEEVEHTVHIPYYKKGIIMRVIDPFGREAARTSIEEFAQEMEEKEVIPENGTGRGKPEQKMIKPEEKKQKSSKLLWIIGFMLLLLVFMIYLLKRGK